MSLGSFAPIESLDDARVLDDPDELGADHRERLDVLPGVIPSPGFLQHQCADDAVAQQHG